MWSLHIIINTYVHVFERCWERELRPTTKVFVTLCITPCNCSSLLPDSRSMPEAWLPCVLCVQLSGLVNRRDRWATTQSISYSRDLVYISTLSIHHFTMTNLIAILFIWIYAVQTAISGWISIAGFNYYWTKHSHNVNHVLAYIKCVSYFSGSSLWDPSNLGECTFCDGELL